MAGLEEESAKPSETAAQPSGDRADALPNAGGAAAEETERPEKKKDGGDDDDEDEEDEFEDVAPPPPLAAAATSTSTSSFFRLDPSSEALAEAATLKSSGNDVFGQGEYAEAVVVYKKALEKLGDEIEEEEEEEKDENENEKEVEEIENPTSSSPSSTSSTSDEATELGATLHANLAACYLKLESFAEARDSADAALRLLSVKKKKEKKTSLLVAKVLLRRASAAAAESDFASAAADAKKAAEEANDSSSSCDGGGPAAVAAFLLAKQATAAAEDYNSKVAEAAEKARDEVVGKLKELGNSLLGRFGLSLDSCAAERDPETGAYSIKFNQGGSSGGGEEAKPLGRS